MIQDNLKNNSLTGAQKAAVFLLMMGEEYSAEVFQNLQPDQISILVSHMSRIRHVSQDDLKQVMEEFVYSIKNADQLLVEGESFLRKVEGSLSKEKAKAVYKELEKSTGGLPFSYFDAIGSDMVVNVIKGEHPQTIALILAWVKPYMAAEILSRLPQRIQPDVAMRVAQIGEVPVEVIQQVDQVLRKEVKSLGDSASREVDGVTALANILNEIETSSEEQILSWIEEKNGQMAEEIRELMFVFEDLIQVDDRGFREILKQVDKQELAVALRTASDELKEKIFSNMSERAVEMLREDMEVMGPVRISEVEKAQQNILRVARQLESEGKLILGKGKEDVFV